VLETPDVARRKLGPPGRNRLSPLRFVVGFGVVSLLADFVYEGARSVTGPYLATLGASAAVVGIVTGAGEAVAYALRLATGHFADRTRRYWAISVVGYAITVVSVPFLALTQALWQASALTISERFGTAVRKPARDTMLAHAASGIGLGKAFGLHEALDQSGALLGPLLVAAMVAASGYRLGFAVLALPAALALVAIAWLRRAVPNPEQYDVSPPMTDSVGPEPLPSRFWIYSLFTGLSMFGFATFGLLGYHLQVRHVVAAPWIPVLYAAAMGMAALAALVFGRVYDAFKLRGLVFLPVAAAIVPFLAFSTTPSYVVLGTLAWGAVMGIHESTMRAAVADLVPAGRRGFGYGVFGAVYGLAWLAGAAAIGALYDQSVTSAELFIVATQVAALVCFMRLR
jgi:MFS family permease